MTHDTTNYIDVFDDMRIETRDGVTLSARVWMPRGVAATPLPAILEILPYRKRDGTAARDATTHAQFAQHDYVCLRVDLRGAGESEGLFDDEYSEQELCDVEDTIAWIAAQPWCSGAVGIMGISWGGFNGLQVAARRPDALKAVITLCSSVDRYADDIHYKGGCQLTENIGWAATAMSWFSMPPDPKLVGESWRDTWLERLENTPFLISDWLTHAARDDYWKHGSVCEDFTQIEAPVLSIAGWHDGYRNTPTKLLEGDTSGPVKAIIGPWNHKYPHIAAPEPRMDFVNEALRWWDHWLKGVPNGVEADPDCRVYVMDGIAPQGSYEERPGKWIGLPEWPAPQIATKTYQLGDGSLGKDTMTSPTSVETRSTCGRAFGEYFPFGFGPGELPEDQRNDDALSACFETDSLSKSMTILGATEARLSISANQTFGQMVVRLCDVAPDGASTLITFGLLNLRYRDGFETSSALEPEQVYDITLQLDQAAYVVPEGHRLRLAISPSYWPFIWPERGDVTLSISAGNLHLPTLQSSEGLSWTPPVGPAPVEAITKTVKDGEERKLWETDGGQDRLTIFGDHGEVEFIEHGLRVASVVQEVWIVDHDDVTTARVKIDWDRSMARGDFAVSTRVSMEMHCDAEAYYVTAHLTAREGEHCVFEREFHDRVCRDPSNNQ
ncbi:CocE/NonD family hydrolase [Yoonia sp. I 8.24]|uniref:CocE/NonD family hydrolase n=1 Tax=Yoonia sp. I 8.24 TaxID=1537229 RepID=UPI001EDE4E6F|nr:CocE/NonD family hydrolase [Yoonia sp. I 8.24]MCG3267252.1 CocE/NonD family hydrolase [Yoonia sp. I 8.24]